MKIQLLILSTFLSACCCAQPEYLKEFYPGNSLFKQQKIKKVIDSFLVNKTVHVKEYDNTGRLTGEFNYYNTSTDNPFVYFKLNDTLYRFKYGFTNKRLYSFEKFIYNKANKILEYQECTKQYTDSPTTALHKFDYDPRGNLISQTIYRSFNYPGKLGEKMNILPTQLDLIDRFDYTYRKLNGKSYVIIKHAVNETDTLIYDEHDRLVKQNRFEISGNMGDRSFDNINDITLFKYKKDSVIRANYITYCQARKRDGTCMLSHISEKTTEVKVFDKNGLLKETWQYINETTKQLSNRFYYEFYK